MGFYIPSENFGKFRVLGQALHNYVITAPIVILMILVVFFIEIILIQQLGIPKYFGPET